MQIDLKGRAPAFGEDVSDEYADSYMNSHVNKSKNYNIQNLNYVIINNMLNSNYKCLDVGCGTAGFIQLMDKCEEYVGIDYSKKMLDRASAMMSRFNFTNHELFCGVFEKYTNQNSYFDIVRLGVYGTYVPLEQSNIDKAYELLKNEGFLFVSYVAPSTIFDKIRYFMGKDKMKMTEKKLVHMLKNSGFNKLVFKFQFRPGSDVRKYLIAQK